MCTAPITKGPKETHEYTQTFRTNNGTLTISTPLWVTEIHPSVGEANPPHSLIVTLVYFHPLWVTHVYFHPPWVTHSISTLLG